MTAELFYIVRWKNTCQIINEFEISEDTAALHDDPELLQQFRKSRYQKSFLKYDLRNNIMRRRWKGVFCKVN